MTVPDVHRPEIICGATEADCHCVLPPDHEGAHECDAGTCGGSWYYDDDGKFHVVALPDPEKAADLDP